MAISRECIIFLIASCACLTEVFTAKGLYCRDPDSGKLYGVNSTWPSTTFCGNYTCKLRKVNSTEMQLAPPTKVVNISHLDILQEGGKLKLINIDNIIHKSLNRTTAFEEKLKPERQPQNNIDNAISKSFEKPARDILDNEMIKDPDDRYLTYEEIKTLCDLLHTVKKSNLDAIVEIYNLAQDIYKEMDKTTPESLTEETTVKNKTALPVKDVVQTGSDSDKISYWYDPLQVSNNNKVPNDLQNQGSNLFFNTAKPVYVTSYLRVPPYRNNYNKVPYYYSMSNFQRFSSYVYNNPSYLPYQPYQPYPPATKPPCDKSKVNVDIIYRNTPSSQPMNKKLISLPSWILMNRPQADVHKKPTLLPFPYSITKYNFTSPSGVYYSNLQPFINKYNIKDLPQYLSAYRQMFKTGAYMYPELTEAPSRAEENAVNIEKDSRLLDTLLISVDKPGGISKKIPIELPAWQTESLADDVIEEIRAKAADKAKIKTFPLRKKVKLQKVGKFYKLDEVRNRNKRKASEENSDKYEVFIEKLTCEPDTLPGYFRVGNTSQPYPACCPQRIISNS